MGNGKSKAKRKDDDDGVPPEIKAMLAEQQRAAANMPDIDAALANLNVGGGVDADGDDDEVYDRVVEGVGGAADVDAGLDELDEGGSLHSSDMRDPAILGDMEGLETQVQRERMRRVRKLEEQKQELRQQAVALSRGGDKPAALKALARSKELDKEIVALQAEIDAGPAVSERDDHDENAEGDVGELEEMCGQDDDDAAIAAATAAAAGALSK